MAQANQIRLLATLYEISEKCEWKKSDTVEQLRERLNVVMGISNARLKEFEKQPDGEKSITLLELWHELFPEGTHTEYEPADVSRWLDAYTEEIEQYAAKQVRGWK